MGSALLLACTHGVPAPAKPAPIAGVNPTAATEADSRDSEAWRDGSTPAPLHYVVKAISTTGTLEVEARFTWSGSTRLVAKRRAVAFIDELTKPNGRQAATWIPIERKDGQRWLDCQNPCRYRYRFNLGEAADKFDDISIAGREGSLLISPHPFWLVRPKGFAGPFSWEIAKDSQLFFSSSAPKSGQIYLGHTRFLDDHSYGVFQPDQPVILQRKAGELVVTMPNSVKEPLAAEVERWITRAAEATETYFGRFPVKHGLALVLHRGGRTLHGMQHGLGGASITLWVGDDVERSDFDNDWKATHEMIHLAFPTMKRKHIWMNEGIATYAEPIARIQASQLEPEVMWRDFVSGMPKGQPEFGDEGLDNTPTWGRTYWGGALFWLVADVAVRKQSQNRLGVQQLLQRVIAEGDNTLSIMDVEDFLAHADANLSKPVLGPLYREHATQAKTIDLEKLWNELGVNPAGGPANDSAPLAAIRRAMTYGAKLAPPPDSE